MIVIDNCRSVSEVSSLEFKRAYCRLKIYESKSVPEIVWSVDGVASLLTNARLHSELEAPIQIFV